MHFLCIVYCSQHIGSLLGNIGDIMNKPILFIIVAYVFLTGCTSTVTGMRQDIAKPFKWAGKLGDKIDPCKTEECNKINSDQDQ